VNGLEADYQEFERGLKHAYRAMQRFIGCSGDWRAQIGVEAEFRNLRNACRDFARRQYGLDITPGHGNGS
jgi:hypothetical protein